MMADISRIDIYHTPVKLKKPFVISLGRLDYADNVVVRLTSDDGLTGFGECSPFATIHGETGETCMAIGRLIGRRILDEQPTDSETLSETMDALIHGNTSVKSAFDIA